MNANTLIDELGGATKIASKLNISPGVVSVWRYRNAIPRAAWPDLIERFPRKVTLAKLRLTEPPA